jgi:lipocalin-like protein
MKIGPISATVFSLALCAVLLYSQQQTGQASIERVLVGTWRLVSTEERLRDGSTRPYPDLGANARGNLIYAEDGHMCVALMNPTRPNWRNDEEHATDTEKISAASGFSSYCGTYKVDEKNQSILHSPEVSFFPNFVGTVQKRPYRLEGKRMIFSGVETTGAVERWTIVWEKVTR